MRTIASILATPRRLKAVRFPPLDGEAGYLGALSQLERDKRKPSPPHHLVDALHDRVHVEKGKLISSMPIKTGREK